MKGRKKRRRRTRSLREQNDCKGKNDRDKKANVNEADLDLLHCARISSGFAAETRILSQPGLLRIRKFKYISATAYKIK